MTGRTCHAVEIDPAYADVAASRWQAFTGNVARLDSLAACRGSPGRPGPATWQPVCGHRRNYRETGPNVAINASETAVSTGVVCSLSSRSSRLTLTIMVASQALT
jgi:hypothetical protein